MKSAGRKGVGHCASVWGRKCPNYIGCFCQNLWPASSLEWVGLDMKKKKCSARSLYWCVRREIVCIAKTIFSISNSWSEEPLWCIWHSQFISHQVAKDTMISTGDFFEWNIILTQHINKIMRSKCYVWIIASQVLLLRSKVPNHLGMINSWGLVDSSPSGRNSANASDSEKKGISAKCQKGWWKAQHWVQVTGLF